MPLGTIGAETPRFRTRSIRSPRIVSASTGACSFRSRYIDEVNGDPGVVSCELFSAKKASDSGETRAVRNAEPSAYRGWATAFAGRCYLRCTVFPDGCCRAISPGFRARSSGVCLIGIAEVASPCTLGLSGFMVLNGVCCESADPGSA